MSARICLPLAVLALAAASRVRAQGTATIDAAGTATPVAGGFAGVSVEMSNVPAWAGTYDPTVPALFDSSLVNLLNLLALYEGPPVVRIGGNSQDRTWLMASPSAAPPAFAYTAAPTLNPITPAQINGLAWVQRLTGAPFTIGLNLGGNLVSEAVAEMAAFQGAFDPTGIMAFDVGNEPDESDFVSYRPPGWGQSAYQANLLAFLGPLRSAAPGAVFAAPAVGGTGWLPPSGTSGFNALLTAVNGQIAFVTAHRYIANGASPPADPIGDLFQASNSSGIAANYTATQAAAKVFGLGVRINETNTFYNGGLAGVSNAMASALWVADVLGSYATNGIQGVNFHGGSSGPYTPFTMTATAGGISVAANPVYYGMMLFAQFIQNGGGLIHATTAGGFPSTSSLYASRDGSGALRVLLINKSQTSAATATVSFNNLAGKYQSAGSLILLQAPSLSATTGLTLGGQSYDTGGNVVGVLAPAAVPGSAGTFSWQVPSGTAALFTLDLIAPVAPAAQVQTSAGQVSPGAPAVFTASVTGTAPFRYQWLFNGSPVAGATGPRLVLPAASAANDGPYSVQVTNGAGSVTSNAVPLVVGAPAIATQPVSQTVASGATVVFAAAAMGSPAPAYQWEFDGNPLPGATGARLVITAATAANAGLYTCLATNSNGSTASNAASLTITTTANPGRLINLSVNTTAGKSQVLTVGFVSGGAGTAGSQNLLIRATGPALASLGVHATLADPTLTVLSGQTAVASNDNWGTPAANQAAVAAADSTTGAFPLTNPASLDAALALPLASGAYTVQIGGNTAASGTALAEIYDNTPANTYTLATPRLINLSAKNQIPAAGSMTVGFVVGGATSKTVLIRATGPALTLLGVPGAIPDPQIALHTTINGQDAVLATNAAWGGDPQITAAGNAAFAFPLTNPASADSVLLLTLAPGAYTAVASSVSGAAGTVLIEVYEVP